MSIKLEHELAARKYSLKRDEKGLLEISLDNVARAEAMINSDSRYNQGEVEDSIKLLSPFIMANNLQPNQDYKEIFNKIVHSINKTNKTRMSDLEMDEIVTHLQIIQNELIKRLYNRDFCLICEIVNSTPKRKNYSFATKFCHYMCYWLFENKKQQDNYSIYDKVVATILGRYAAQCNIFKTSDIQYKFEDFNSYKQYATYSEVIDKIRAANRHISRNGLDHLLWFANK